MAIYRPEQAQLTYAAEASFGGDSELARGVVSGWTAIVNQAEGVPAGSIEIVMDNVSGTPTIGDFVLIGTADVDTAANYSANTVQHEIRRVEWISGTTIGLDRPTGFFHADDQTVKEVTGLYTGTNHKKSKAIRNIPGVYETVDAPDLAPTLEPQYFLGTKNRRSFQTVLKSQQSFDTALTMTPLNGLPLRWGIGKVTTCAEDMGYGSDYSTLTANVKKGDIIIPVADVPTFGTVSGSGVLSAGEYVTFLDIAHSNTNTNSSTIEDAVAALGDNPESRKVIYGETTSGGSTGAGVIWLDQPLQFDHTTGHGVASHGTSAITFRHVISETDILDTMSWHVHMLDSDETGNGVSTDAVPTADSSFDRRYTGGKVNSSTISADEGGLLQVSWDSINFRGMLHNNRNHANIETSRYADSGFAANMPYFALMQSITADDIDYPTSEPYYFSEGQLKFYGVTFARIRSFSLTVNNNVEPRYYVNRTFGPFRGPSELREQRREYGLTATVVLPDVSDNFASSRDNATALFRELLLEGNYGTDSVSAVKGFTASLRFDRGTDDYFIIDIPNSQAATGEGKPLFANEGSHGVGSKGDNSATGDVGLFIRSAPHNLTTDAPMQIDLDMFFKNLVIYVKDKESSYI